MLKYLQILKEHFIKLLISNARLFHAFAIAFWVLQLSNTLQFNVSDVVRGSNSA